MAWRKTQDPRANGIQPAVTPLLARRRRAADRSFERFYEQHVHAVYRYALAVLHNAADAEDVTQTTFLNAYRAFQRDERPHKPRNWLIKIAHNVCRQRFRESSRRPREVEFDDALAAAPPHDADAPTATEIRRALGFLAFNQRAALVMRELEDRSYAEIAEVLDISVSAVETLLFRARRALREQLEGGLTCQEAKLTLERLQDRKLSASERGALRAHLRECQDCATLERRQRAQRAALKHLGTVPLPASLASFFGGGATGGVAVGGLGIGTKVATVLAAGLVATSVGHDAVKAGATDASAPTARHTAPQRAQVATSSASRTRARASTLSRRTTQKGRRSSRAAHARTPEHRGTNPIQAVPRPGGDATGAGTQPPPPSLRLPVQPPAVRLPEAPPVQLPPLPPVQLPPPPIELPPPPIQLPPPPPIP